MKTEIMDDKEIDLLKELWKLLKGKEVKGLVISGIGVPIWDGYHKVTIEIELISKEQFEEE